MGRREQRLMSVIGVTDFAQKEFQVVPLGEARQLRDIIQSDINKTGNFASPEEAEEFAGGLLRKADRKDFHSGSLARRRSAILNSPALAIQ